jgi:hypothetical protein
MPLQQTTIVKVGVRNKELQCGRELEATGYKKKTDTKP